MKELEIKFTAIARDVWPNIERVELEKVRCVHVNS